MLDLFDWILDPDAWATLLTLAALEIVLGIDNIILLAILVGKLPPHYRDRGRVLGLGFAMLTRIALLLSLFWVMKLNNPLFSILENEISGRDLVLFLGGLFLFFKSLKEIKEQVMAGSKNEEKNEEEKNKNTTQASLWIVVCEIALIDIVFSLDSVITAVGIAQEIMIMIIAVILAVGVMLFASKPIADFVEAYPSIKILALAFLALIGVVLICECFDLHIPKAYIYTAMGFSLIVEILNIIETKNKKVSK